MNLNGIEQTSVFADWLDVTCSPESSFIESVQYALDSMGGSISSLTREPIIYQLGKGSVRLQRSKFFHKVGVSGAALSYLRSIKKLDYLLCVINENPHSITRLDASLDALQDGADVFAYFQKRFSKTSRYPSLTRKTVTPSYFSSLRESDGRTTGTVNIGGYRNTKVSARIYDKQHEALQKRGEILPCTTRYELTVRKDMQPSLRDVSDPTAIFWHYMGKTLLKRPDGIPNWEPGWGGAWNMTVDKPLVYEVLKSKIENNPELLRILELADTLSPDGRQIALNLIKRTHIDRCSLTQASA